MKPAELKTALNDLKAKDLYRLRPELDSPQDTEVRIDGQSYLSFASNNYLGLANHTKLVLAAQAGLEKWGMGSGASALVTGHYAFAQRVETDLAHFVGQAAGLLFGSGYQANLAVITSFADRETEIFADKLVHASLIDACLLSRATLKRFHHNDLNHLEQLLKQSTATNKMVVVDAVYSMDGDEAPLAALANLAKRYDAWLYLDDAHGFGLTGHGHGALKTYGIEGENILYMATLGKAAGVSGAFVAASHHVIDWLVNKARTYIYTTAMPPCLISAIQASLKLIASEEGQQRRKNLQDLIAQLKHGLAQKGYPALPTNLAIQPIIVGDNAAALALSESCKAAGIWVPAIRPPTVPQGQARLRISLCANHQADDIDRLLTVLPNCPI